MDSPEINPHIHGEQVHDKGAKNIYSVMVSINGIWKTV